MGHPVVVYVYDLSGGLARSLSMPLLGRHFDGIWHTSIVVFGREFYFGGGICCGSPGQTPYGTPVNNHSVGETAKTEQEFVAFLDSMRGKYNMSTYDLLANNCNNFSDDCARFLTDTPIPEYITSLPQAALQTPMIAGLLRNLQSNIVQNQDNILPRGSPLFGTSAQSGSNVTTSAPTSSSTHRHSALSLTYLPNPSPVLFQRSNIPKMSEKLIETLHADGIELGDELLESLEALITDMLDEEESLSDHSVKVVCEAILKIPDAQVFPFADLLRVCMTRSDLINSNVIEDFSSLLGPLSDRLFAATFPSTNPSGFLFIQALANLLGLPQGKESVQRSLNNARYVIDVLAQSLIRFSKQPRPLKGCAALALNLALSLKRVTDAAKAEEYMLELAQWTGKALPSFVEMCGAEDDSVYKNDFLTQIVSSLTIDFTPWQHTTDEKIRHIMQDLAKLFHSQQ